MLHTELTISCRSHISSAVSSTIGIYRTRTTQKQPVLTELGCILAHVVVLLIGPFISIWRTENRERLCAKLFAYLIWLNFCITRLITDSFS